MSHKTVAVAFLAGFIGLSVAGCSGTAGFYNSSEDAANGSRSSGSEVTPVAHVGATPDQKWTHCTPGSHSGDITAMKSDAKTHLTIGAYDAYPVRDLDDPKNAISNAELIYSFGRPGFEKDHPKAAQLVRNLAVDDEHLSSLEHLIVETTDKGGQQDTAIAAWMKDNARWVDDWQAGKLGDDR